MAKAQNNNKNSTLFMEFARYFDLSLALTPEQRAQVYQVRYRVYCEEFNYEPTEIFTNQQEIDEFDDKSMHCIVIHRGTGRPAGCVRLVMVDGEDRLPMEIHSGGSIDQQFMSALAGQRSTFGEISRLAVDGDFRRRRGEDQTRFGAAEPLDFTPGEQRTFPLIAVSLFLASAAVADLMGRTNCFAIMEPFLPVILRRTGVHFQRIGEDFDFRGVRAPYHANLDDLVRGVPDDLRLCFFAVRDQFAGMLRAAHTEPGCRIPAFGCAGQGEQGNGREAPSVAPLVFAA